MADLYFDLIVNNTGLMTVEGVPALWRNQVNTMLEENGYVINIDGTVTKE